MAGEIVVVSDLEHDRHDTGEGHPERRARVPAALSGLDSAGLGEAVVRLVPRPASTEELGRVHSESYLRALQAFCSAGGGMVDPDTVAGPGSWETAVLAAGAPLTAVEALRQGQGDVALVVMRPPGHHATSDQAMGFCLMNNVAVAAAALSATGERVVVVDWDVHHGNGTQAIFWDEPNVLYLSTHQSPLYPGTGQVGEVGGAGAPGTTVNVPLPPGATGDIVRRAFDEVLSPVVERFAPQWVLVSGGFDAHRLDPLADLALTAGDFADLASQVRRWAPAAGRTVLVLEGGYDLDALRMSVGASVAALVGHVYRPEPGSSGGPGAQAVAAARRRHSPEGSGR